MIFLRFYFNDDDDVDVAKCYAKPFMTDGWERKRGEREKRERSGGASTSQYHKMQPQWQKHTVRRKTVAT